MGITSYVRSKLNEFKENKAAESNEREEQKYYANVEQDAQIERKKAYVQDEEKRLKQKRDYYTAEKNIVKLKKEVATEQFNRTTLGRFLGSAQSGIKRIQSFSPKTKKAHHTKTVRRTVQHNPFSMDSAITNSMFGISTTPSKTKKQRLVSRGGGWSLPF